MLSEKQFTALLAQVRAGDQDAASRLVVKLYEPDIRRAARIRLTDPKLRRMVEFLDICQSVFVAFFTLQQTPRSPWRIPSNVLALLPP